MLLFKTGKLWIITKNVFPFPRKVFESKVNVWLTGHCMRDNIFFETRYFNSSSHFCNGNLLACNLKTIYFYFWLSVKLLKWGMFTWSTRGYQMNMTKKVELDQKIHIDKHLPSNSTNIIINITTSMNLNV